MRKHRARPPIYRLEKHANYVGQAFERIRLSVTADRLPLRQLHVDDAVVERPGLDST